MNTRRRLLGTPKPAAQPHQEGGGRRGCHVMYAPCCMCSSAPLLLACLYCVAAVWQQHAPDLMQPATHACCSATCISACTAARADLRHHSRAMHVQQQHSSMAAQQRSSTAAQQHSSTAAQQHSSTAAQQHSSAAARLPRPPTGGGHDPLGPAVAQRLQGIHHGMHGWLAAVHTLQQSLHLRQAVRERAFSRRREGASGAQH
jgi:hypothetical protein